MADNQYKIELGTKLNTTDLAEQIGKLDNKHKIKVGIDLGVEDIRKRISSYNENTNNAKLKLKIKLDTSDLKKQIGDIDLSVKGKGLSVPVNTKSLEDSLKEVSGIIKDIRNSLGTIDDKSDMKSLVASINQIATALEKATNESDGLVASLNALSKKDFSVNFGLNTGGSNPIGRNVAYGNKVRNETLPQLKQQVESLVKYYNKEYKTSLDEFTALSKLASKANLGDGNFFNTFLYGDNSVAARMSSGSLASQMQAYKEYIDMFKKAASLSGLDLTTVTSQFSKTTDALIKDAQDIQTGANEMQDGFEKIKSLFSGGIDSEGLSASLKPIITNLEEIKKAIQELSKVKPFDGLTDSFDRLSDSIKNLLANAEKVKGVLGSGLGDSSVKDTTSSSSATGATPIKSAQQTGQKIGEAIRESAQQSINLDDVIDQQVLDLMDTFSIAGSIAGDKGSKAFNEIKQAVIECRNELNILKNSDVGIDEEVFDSSRAVDKVTDAIANQYRAVNNLGDEYVKLAEKIEETNKREKGYKIQIPEFVKQEQGDDYRSNRGSLGAAFTTGKGTSFADFIDQINNELGQTIDLTKGEAEAFDELLRKVEIGKQQKKALEQSDRHRTTIASTEEILEQNGINREEISNHTRDVVDIINSAEQQIAQASTQSANVVSQSEEKKRQEYRKTADTINQITGFESAQNELKNLNFNTHSLDTMIDDFNRLGVTVKEISHTLNKDGSITFNVNGVDKLGNAIKAVKTLDSSGSFKSFSSSISQSLKESDTFIKQQKRAVADLTNDINELNRKAIDPNESKPIKDSSHLKSLEIQYKTITEAIEKMGRASNDNDFQKERNNVNALISEYKSLTREYKNAETVATSLRSKDIDTVKSTYGSDLDVLIQKMKDADIYTSGFKKGAENLRSALSNATDKSELVSFLNGLDKLDAGYKRAAQSVKSFRQAETYGKRAQGLEQSIKNIQRISSEINEFEVEINGAKVSIQSLLTALSQVKTKSSFDSINEDLKVFKKAAEAAGIAIRETATKTNLVPKIKDKLKDTGFNGFKQEVARAHAEVEKLEGGYNDLKKAIEDLDNAMKGVYSVDQNDNKRLVAANEEYENSLKRVYSQLKLYQQAEKQAFDAEMLEQKKASLNSEMEVWLKENSRAAKDFGEEIRRLQSSLDGLDDRGVKIVGQQFKTLTKQAQAMGKTGLTLFDQLKSKAKQYFAYLSAAEMFMYAEQALRSMFEAVKEVDTAMTGLYRVTDLTAAEYDSLFNDMISSAKEYGATLTDIINATTDWVRAGFDANTSLGLAEVTTMYQHISDLDYDTAAENLITAYNGFKDELNGAFDGDQVAAVEYIADIFNELDNNFAVTSAGLGEALTRSASALDLAGNSIQQTAGMVTGIVEVTQDPEKAGSALKVLSLRLRGMKGKLEEIGEETDENVENISKMQGQILNMTGGKVNIFDASGNFKSTYEIMQGIAQIWDDLNSIDQANLLETIAGKNRANDVAALLSNWENVEAAVKSATEAEGSAAEENAKYVDSIQGRLDKLTTSWQSFANTFMSSDFLKGAVSGLTGLVDIIEKLVGKLGTIGTIGAGAGIFALFKNKGLFTGILGELSTFGSLAMEAWSSGGKLTNRFKDVGKASKMAGGSIVSKFTSSLSGMIGGIGLAVAAIGLIVNAIKNYREEQSRLRQETIETSNEFLDSADSFEQAYIKYAGKTDLTVEEEQELESAINGTVDALGDKSSALQNVVNNSNDYVASLEAITNAELKAAEASAQKKKTAAEEELNEKAREIGANGRKANVRVFNGTASEIDDAETVQIAKEIGDKYYGTIRTTKFVKQVGFMLPNGADVKQIIDYYYMLVEYQEKLIDQNLSDTDAYRQTTAAIDQLSESVKVYTSGVYDAAKAQYQLSNGIPKTIDEYLKMREAILRNSDIKGLSLDAKSSIANTLDSEYKSIFDLSSAEVQAKKFIGLIKGYGNGTVDGTNEIGTVETFLNMRTAVNNNECTVGEYLAQFDEIDKMTSEWSDEEKELLNTSFGLDTDAIKEQYEEMEDYLSRKIPDNITGVRLPDENVSSIKANYEDIKQFLDSLTSDELQAVIDLRTEIDWENTSAEDIRKQIEDQVKLNEALNFNASIEVDKTALEALSTAFEESASAMGLSEESIDSLKAKYSELEGYNPHTLFEKTANGVKVNREELAKLEKKYNDLTKTEVQEHLDTLVEEYNKCTKAIDGNIGSQEKLELISKREKYAEQIEELATYQAQLEGVTGAYQRWIDAQNTPEDYEGYQAIATSREDIEDEISRGFLSNSTKEYIDLLSGKDLVGGSIDDYYNAWKKLDDKVIGAGYSINDLFTVNDDGDITSTGIDRFFKSLQHDFKGSVAKFNEETEKWEYDFSQDNLKKIQDEWGLGIEAIELLLEAAASAGYDVDWGGIFDDLDLDTSNFESLVSVAEAAQKELNKLEGYEDLDFNFSTTNVEDATSELEKAQKTYNELVTGDDGKININAKGADQARVILATLLVQKQQLEDSEIAINISTSGLDDSQAKAVAWVQDFRAKYKNLEIAISTGEGIEEAKTELETVKTSLGELDGDTAKIAAQLVLGENTDTSGDGFKTQVNNAIDSIGKQDINVGFKLDETSISDLNSKLLTNFTIDATAKVTKVDKSQLETVETGGMVNWAENTDGVSKSFEADGTVNWNDNIKNVKTSFSASGTVNWTSGNKVKVNVVSEVNGTANANGTAQSGHAFAHGNWGIKGSGTALVGELGMETLVRGGKFYTIGDNGAEFIQYRPNDIIFNHKQTEELFKYGKVLSDGGRGRMFANGSAFADGNYPTEGKSFWKASVGSSLFASSHSNSTWKKDQKKSSKDKKEETKVEVTVKDDKVKTVTKSSNKGTNATETNFSKDNQGNSEDKLKTENKFEETFDWIEIAISRIEREIDNLDKRVNSTYTSWEERNTSLASEITKVGKEIKLQSDAANEYLAEANSIGLDETYAEKVRNGTLNLEDFKGENDEALVEKIKEYQKWYELYLKCTDAAEDLRQEEAKLYAQRFENVQSEYDSVLQGFEHTESMLNEYISQAEAKGHVVSKKYYQALIDNEKSNIAELQKEQADLITKRDEAVASGAIVKGSQAWYDMCAEIDSVTQAIEEGNTALIEYANSMRDIDWEVFDLIQERISDITSEADFLIELMSNDKLHNDDGNLTDKGVATIGLHAQNMNTYMYAADDYGKEIADIDAKIASGELDGNSQDVINRRRELVELQREAILNAEQEKQAIKDLVSEGIEKELDALQERIDLHNKELDSMRDLYDYQKSVQKQSEEISKLEKQRASYLGDDSEESKAKLQEITVSLNEAKQSLEETEFDRYITQQEQLLDEFYLEYENTLNARLDDTDALIQQVVDGINTAYGAEGTITSALGAEGAIAQAMAANGTTIKTTLENEAKNVGITLSTAMSNIWTADGSGKAIIDLYGQDFQKKQTTTNDALNNIKTDVAAMVDDVDKEAETKVDSEKTDTSANNNPPKKPDSIESKDSNTNRKFEATEDTLKSIASVIWCVDGKGGWTDDPHRKNKLTEKLGSANAEKVQDYINKYGKSGKLYQHYLKLKTKGNLKSYYYNAFATGAKNIDETQLAWTQEKGQEFIVRPSDGAILTPVAKKDSILNAKASENLWNMSNSPAEFIKDNLRLDTVDVPNNSNVQNSCVQNFKNITFSLPNVHSYNELLREMKDDPKFEKLILSMTLDQIAGKSSLAKGKSIR